MSGTTSFYNWFYEGLGGLGGWFLFFLFAVAALIWLFYNSSTRRIPALGWKWSVSVSAFLILPALLYVFTVKDFSDVATAPLGRYGEPIFYLGILGGVLPVVIAASYFFTYQGLAVCPQGHLYDPAKGKCPHKSHHQQQHHHNPKPPAKIVPERPRPEPEPEPVVDVTEIPERERLNAWLITLDGSTNYQLFVSETKIGRASNNDVVLQGDRSVSRESARILEQNGRFRLYPVNPGIYPRINNQVVRQPILLEPDDEIQLGEDTTLRFVTSRANLIKSN